MNEEKQNSKMKMVSVRSVRHGSVAFHDPSIEWNQNSFRPRKQKAVE